MLEESGVPSVLLEYAPGGALSAALPKLVPASATVCGKWVRRQFESQHA